MIISSKQVQSVLKAYGEHNKSVKKAENAGFQTLQKQDEVILSSSAQEFSQMLQSLSDIADVREAKINDLSSRLQNGTYHVDAKDIADKIISRTLIDNLW